MLRCPDCQRAFKENQLKLFNGKINYGSYYETNAKSVEIQCILGEIKTKLAKIKEYYHGDISIDLSSNGISAKSVNGVLKFLKANASLHQTLVGLNLRNNDFDVKAFGYIKSILFTCPNVSIDITGNRIKQADMSFFDNFGDRVTYSQ